MRRPFPVSHPFLLLATLGLIACQSPRPTLDPAFAERMLRAPVRGSGDLVVEIAGLQGTDEEVAIAVRFVAPSPEQLEFLCLGWFNWQDHPGEHLVVEGPQGPIELVPWPNPWRDFRGTVSHADVPTPSGAAADGREIAILICSYRTPVPDEVTVALLPDRHMPPQVNWDTTPRTFRVRDDAR